MLTPRIAKVHHNKTPPIGAIVVCHVDDRDGWTIGRHYRRFIVESYPGFRADRFAPFSDGHLVNLKALDSDWRTTVACHWLEEI